MIASSRDRVLAAFALGLARQPIPTLDGFGAVTPLTALALAGQGLRLTPPSPPTEPERAWRLPDDPLPPLPQRARAMLLRLMNGLDAFTARTIAPRLLAQIVASGHRLHPFDYPRLGPLLTGATVLRPPERAWLNRAEPPAGPPLTDATWRDAPLGPRLEFLRSVRLRDPDAARALLEQAFTTDPVKARADLLAAMQVGLSVADRPFLLACATDRAVGVKQLAETLLDKLPDSASSLARLAAATAAFQAMIRTPPPVPPQAALQVLDGFGLAALASGPLPQDWPGRVASDAARLALAACALRDGDTDIAAALMDAVGELRWPDCLVGLGAAFKRLPAAERHAFAARVFRPADPFGIGGDWLHFGILLGSPLAPPFVQAMLRSDGWRGLVAKLDDRQNADATLLPVAVLIPPPLAVAMEATLAPISPERRPRTTVLLGFLAELAALTPTDGTAS